VRGAVEPGARCEAASRPDSARPRGLRLHRARQELFGHHRAFAPARRWWTRARCWTAVPFSSTQHARRALPSAPTARRCVSRRRGCRFFRQRSRAPVGGEVRGMVAVLGPGHENERSSLVLDVQKPVISEIWGAVRGLWLRVGPAWHVRARPSIFAVQSAACQYARGAPSSEPDARPVRPAMALLSLVSQSPVARTPRAKVSSSSTRAQRRAEETEHRRPAPHRAPYAGVHGRAAKS
jgi:hypothetical protein